MLVKGGRWRIIHGNIHINTRTHAHMVQAAAITARQPARLATMSHQDGVAAACMPCISLSVCTLDVSTCLCALHSLRGIGPANRDGGGRCVLMEIADGDKG